jgi:cyanobactin maturation PatA/PatG family protease
MCVVTATDPASFAQSPVPQAAPAIDRFEGIGLGPALSELRMLAQGPSPVVVGIIDGPVATGIPAFHDADLQVAPAHENRPSASGAATRHGTHIASILFARDGLIPRCCGLLAPVVGERDDGAIVPADQFMLARAIEMLVEGGADIINVSAGQRVAYPDADAVLHKALALCAERDVLIVAAAGNDGCACADIPAALPPVLAVGSHDSAGRPSKFSNFADAYAGSGLLAPGETIWGLDPSGAEVAAKGTSYSAAIVSGVAALLMSACAAQGRAIGGRAILDALRKTARACAPGEADGATCLAGRLDVAAAMSELDLGRAGARPIFFVREEGDYEC